MEIEANIVTVNEFSERLEAIKRLFADARNHIDILDYDLEKRIFEDNEIFESIKQVAIRSRRAQIRILIHEPSKVIKEGHKFISLIERMSSSIELRVLNENDKQQAKTNLIIIDKNGYCETKNHHPFSGKICLSDKKVAEDLSKKFEDYWNKGERPLDILRLGI